MIAFETMNLPLILCGLFYGVLCIFSIVTGLIYMSGKRKLNPLELSDSFVERLSEKDKLNQFTIFMGFVTFAVGIVQGITSYCLFQANSALGYYFAFGFNLFSICSVLFKLKGKINAFPLIKLCAYLLVLIVLLLNRALFLH